MLLLRGMLDVDFGEEGGFVWFVSKGKRTSNG